MILHSHKMEAHDTESSVPPRKDSKEVNTGHQDREGGVAETAQMNRGEISPLTSSQSVTKRALVDSLSSGCFDEGELDYDELMEGDREKAVVVKAAVCCAEDSSGSKEVEEGEVTSDEEGEIQVAVDTDNNNGEKVSSSKKGTSSRSSQLPSHEPVRNKDLPNKVESNHPAICRHFIQGKCSWGRGCRFLHHDPTEELLTPRDFPFDHEPFAPHSEYMPPLRGGHTHRIFPRPVGLDPMCPPPFLAIPEPIPLPPYREPTLMYPGGGPRAKWGPKGTFPEAGKLKTSDVEEESEGWHRLRTVTRKWDSDDDHTHTTPSDKPKHKKEEKDSDSGAEVASSPEQGKNIAQSSSSEVWTDPWSRQGPSGHAREKKKRHDLTSYHGDAQEEATSKKGRGSEETPTRYGTEVRRTREKNDEEMEPNQVSTKKGPPGEEEVGEGRSRKRGLSASPNETSGDSVSDVEEKMTAKKKARKERSFYRRDNKLNLRMSNMEQSYKEERTNKTERHLSPSHPREELYSHLSRRRGHPQEDASSKGFDSNSRRLSGQGGKTQRGNRAGRPELSGTTAQRGSSGDEERSPTPAPSDSISSESDLGPGDCGEAGTVRKPTLQKAQKEGEQNPLPLKQPTLDEDAKTKSRQAKLLEELNAINREIEKKRTQAARV